MRRREGEDDEKFTWRVCYVGKSQDDCITCASRRESPLYADVLSGWNLENKN